MYALPHSKAFGHLVVVVVELDEEEYDDDGIEIVGVCLFSKKYGTCCC